MYNRGRGGGLPSRGEVGSAGKGDWPTEWVIGPRARVNGPRADEKAGFKKLVCPKNC